MKENIFKTIIAAAAAAAAAYFKLLALPLLVLIVTMATDYITGMISAGLHGEISSKKGISGILKKICYIFGVGVGIIVDYICNSSLAIYDKSGGACFFGVLVTVWLILNEATSILENLNEIGVPLPNFLYNVIQQLKNNTTNNTNTSNSDKK